MNKLKILIILGHYLPGYKSGGPLVSIVNLVKSLGDEFEFTILTSDRDLGDLTPYSGIQLGKTQLVNNVHVRYLTKEEQSFRSICKIINEIEHDVLYINSFFSKFAGIYPLLGRRIGFISPRPTIIAPRGQFSTGALAIKPRRKRLFLQASQFFSLTKNVNWQASSILEASDIAHTIKCTKGRIFIGRDLSATPSQKPPSRAHYASKHLQVLFLSRISPMKNLDFALSVLRSVEASLDFNIYGPIEDHEYWAACQNLITQLPKHITVTYHGPANPSLVANIMEQNDVFFLPSRGENFGHVIAEALSTGTPVLISDQTPWQDLTQKGLGADIPLSQKEMFVSTLENWASTMPKDLNLIRQKTYQAYLNYFLARKDIEENREMFNNVYCKNSSGLEATNE